MQSICANRVIAQNDGLLIYVERKHYLIKWADCSPLLKNASPEERQLFELSPAGYGIHWPLLDEDLSIKGLIRKMSININD